MRAQPPGPRDISVQQTEPAQPCRAQTEMKRLVGSCSLIGRKGLYFSPDRRMVPRMGELGVCYREISSSVCKSISVTSADPVASVQ